MVRLQIKLDLKKMTMDGNAAVNALMPYFRMALDEAENKLIEMMTKEIDATSSAPREWRESLKEDIHHISEEISNSRIQYNVGVNYAQGSGMWMRAMVIAYGMGIYGLNGNRIYAGPEGRMVWDKSLLAKKPSSVKEEHEIPDTWYHKGRQFVENAVRNMQAVYDSVLTGGLVGMPSTVLLGCVSVQ